MIHMLRAAITFTVSSVSKISNTLRLATAETVLVAGVARLTQTLSHAKILRL